MEFFGREAELALLEKYWGLSSDKGRIVVVTGRRRIGKTLLTRVFCQNKPHLFLFVAKKTEVLLCQEFIKQIKESFDYPIVGEITTFQDIFKLLLEIGKSHHFILVLDEFQEFFNINPSIFSDMQKLWDEYLFQTKVELILMGSVYSLMHKIFQDAHEPLFGRADRIIHLKPFHIHELWEILKKYHHNRPSTLFNYYFITGGVPKYVEALLLEKVFSEQQIFSVLACENSFFLDEGKNVLIEEFGKEYGIYFSILELISVGKTSRSEMESILQRDVGGYLERLENYYGVITRHKPIHAKPQTRLLKYFIRDNFLKFWFRFFYRNWTAIETSNFEYVLSTIQHHIASYKGPLLEHFFRALFAETKQFNQVGSYWDNDGGNEIDLVALNDFNKTITLAEIKLNKNRIRLDLKQKGDKVLAYYPGYEPTYLALSLNDVEGYLS